MRARVMRRLAEARPDAPPFLLADCGAIPFIALRCACCGSMAGRSASRPRRACWTRSSVRAARRPGRDLGRRMAPATIGRSTTPSTPGRTARYGARCGQCWIASGAAAARPPSYRRIEHLREQQEQLYAAHRAQLVPLIEHVYTTYDGHLATTRAAGSRRADHAGLPAAGPDARAGRAVRRRHGRRVPGHQSRAARAAGTAVLGLVTRDGGGRSAPGDLWLARGAARQSAAVPIPAAMTTSIDQALRQNYRSRDAICRIANLALLRSEFEGRRRWSPGATTRQRDPSTAVVGLHLLPAVEDEAAFVAAEMRRLLRCRRAGVRHGAAAACPYPSADASSTRWSRLACRIASNGGFRLLSPAVGPAARLAAGLLLDPDDRTAAVHVLESPLVGLDLRLLGAMPEMSRAPGGAGSPSRRPCRPVCAARQIVRRLAAFGGALQNRACALAAGSTRRSAALACECLRSMRPWWQEHGQQQALRDADKLVALAHTWQQQEPGLGLAGYVTRLRKQIDEQPRESVPVEYASGCRRVPPCMPRKDANGRSSSSPIPRCRRRVRRRSSMCYGTSAGA